MVHVVLELVEWCLVGLPSSIALSAVLDADERGGNVALAVFLFCSLHFLSAVWYHLRRAVKGCDDGGGYSIRAKVFMEYILSVSLCGIFDSNDFVYCAYCMVCALGMELMFRSEEVVRWPLFFMVIGHLVFTASMIDEFKDVWLLWFLVGFMVILSGMDWVVSSWLRRGSVHAFFYAQLSLGVFVVLHIARVNGIGGALAYDDEGQYLF